MSHQCAASLELDSALAWRDVVQQTHSQLDHPQSEKPHLALGAVCYNIGQKREEGPCVATAESQAWARPFELERPRREHPCNCRFFTEAPSRDTRRCGGAQSGLKLFELELSVARLSILSILARREAARGRQEQHEIEPTPSR